MKYIRAMVLCCVLVASCKGTKSVSGTTDDLAVKNIVMAHEAASPDFTTLAARVLVVYEDDKKQQSITVSLRMEKDKIIWMKASLLGITLAKAKITPQRVGYYETIGNTYFDGDFSLLSNWLGTDLDFQKVQAILLGQSIFPIANGRYTSEVVGDRFKLQPKVQPQNFIHSLLILSGNFKIASETLSQPSDGRILNVRYTTYQRVDDQLYPDEINLLASENERTTKIDLTFKKVEPNVSISFPFNIPAGYSEIEL